MSKKKKEVHSLKKRLSAREREEILLENFVGLQKAMTNLSIKFEALTDQIVRLLQIFELSTKSIIEGSTEKSNKEMLDKINSLLDQNKTIAKGLVLMEEKLKQETPGISSFDIPDSLRQAKPRPVPRL